MQTSRDAAPLPNWRAKMSRSPHRVVALAALLLLIGEIGPRASADFQLFISATPVVRGPWTPVTIQYQAGWNYPYSGCLDDRVDYVEITGTDGYWFYVVNIPVPSGVTSDTVFDTLAYSQGPYA